MRKLTTYWYSLRQSISVPEYYFTLKSARIFFSLQFFLLSLFFIALLEIPNWAFRIIPTTLSDIRQESTYILEQISGDAVFTYTGEKLKTDGLDLPLTITSSKKAQDNGFPKNLIEITDQEKSTNVSALTLTPTHILVHMEQDPAGEATYTDFFGDIKGSASRDQIRTVVFAFFDRLQTMRLEMAIGLAAFGFIASLTSGALTIFLYSIVVQVIGWMFGVRITYKFAVRWGLHIFPIALAVQEISSLIAPSGTFPILSVTYIAIATLILWVGRSERRIYEL